MSNDISEPALSSWNECIRLEFEYYTARYHLHLKHRSELLALVKQGLESARDAHLAFQMAKALTEEEKLTLLPILLGWCSSMKYSKEARDLILHMPREYLLENIEVAVEPTLAQNDFLDWVNILSLFADLDLAVAHRQANKMLAHSDSELREWGEEFLSEHRESEQDV